MRTAHQETSPVFALCDQYISGLAELDPVSAGIQGLSAAFGAATDYSPDGYAARAELITQTLARLGSLPVTDETERIAALYLRERLEAELGWHEAGEPLCQVRTPFGLLSELRGSVDMLPTHTEEDWRNIAARLSALPAMLDGWRASLEEGLRRGLAAARRQAIGQADQAAQYAFGRTHDPLIASYGSGSLADVLASAAATAYSAYSELARYLRESYAPRASSGPEGVDPQRYVVNSRLALGAELDLREAYDWGWDELARIESEIAAEANLVRTGASMAEASAILDATEFVIGEDAYQAWLQERHDEAISRVSGVVFDIPEELRRIEVVLMRGSASGAPYYSPPSEDLTRPGQTWWPLGGRTERFTTWNELTVVFHEGVPGHHLQDGGTVVAPALSRFARTSLVSGHCEGWALYAERLADELGLFSAPGTRLGMLVASATRAARVVIDIGVHMDLPLPDGSRWSFAKACEVLRERGRIAENRLVPEVTRYFGWPGQASSYKLGERAWLAARASASRKPYFDLKRWHTAALRLGPLGLGSLTEELARIY